MRCIVTLKNGSAMERAAAALAKYRYHTHGEPVVPEGNPWRWKNWLLEIDTAEFPAIRDHVDIGDIVEMKPINEPASLELH